MSERVAMERGPGMVYCKVCTAWIRIERSLEIAAPDGRQCEEHLGRAYELFTGRRLLFSALVCEFCANILMNIAPLYAEIDVAKMAARKRMALMYNLRRRRRATI